MNKAFNKIVDQVDGLNNIWSAYGVDNSEVDELILTGMTTFFDLQYNSNRDEQAQEIETELSRLIRNIGELTYIMEDYINDLDVIIAYKDNMPIVTNIHDLIYVYIVKEAKEINNQIIINIV